MASSAEAVKHPSDDGDAPEAKKVRLEEIEASVKDKISAENNNGTVNVDNNLKKLVANDGSSGNDAGRASNGQAKGSTGSDVDEQVGCDELTAEKADSEADEFDPEVSQTLQSVEAIQQQISKLNEQASEEILKVEQKFNKLRRPHFEQRNALLKDIPNFWLTCLTNHPVVTRLIESMEDEDCLRYLVNLDVEELEDIKSGYNLKFRFKENPYFKNELLVRELRHLNSDEVVSKSTQIEWKDTEQAARLKRMITIPHAHNKADQFSFISWFSLPCESGSDDYAELIKDQIWPSPLEFFFHGSAVDDYSSTDGEDESLEGEGEDSDEEDYDEDFDVEGVIPAGGLPDEDLEGEELDDEDVDDDDDDDDNDEEDGEDDVE